MSEGERRRWAQELHDGALQSLAAVRITLAAALQGRGEDRDAQIERAAEQTVEGLEDQITELSRLINDLRPASLERLGLHGGAGGAGGGVGEPWRLRRRHRDRASRRS